MMLRSNLQIFQLNLTLNMFQIQTTLRSNQFMMMKCTISWDYFIKNMINISSGFDLHMLQDLLVVAPPLNINAVSNVLFHKYGGANFAVTNCISHFSMFVSTKTIV